MNTGLKTKKGGRTMAAPGFSREDSDDYSEVRNATN